MENFGQWSGGNNYVSVAMTALYTEVNVFNLFVLKHVYS